MECCAAWSVARRGVLRALFSCRYIRFTFYSNDVAFDPQKVLNERLERPPEKKHKNPVALNVDHLFDFHKAVTHGRDWVDCCAVMSTSTS